MTTPEQSMVERCARAAEPDLWLAIDRGESSPDYREAARERSMNRVRAVLTALLEPTEEMVEEGWGKLIPHPETSTIEELTSVREIFRAMIDGLLKDDLR